VRQVVRRSPKIGWWHNGKILMQQKKKVKVLPL